jgi:hypothetical protein
MWAGVRGSRWKRKKKARRDGQAKWHWENAETPVHGFARFGNISG